jgi:hypothetical protein
MRFVRVVLSEGERFVVDLPARHTGLASPVR